MNSFSFGHAAVKRSVPQWALAFVGVLLVLVLATPVRTAHAAADARQ